MENAEQKDILLYFKIEGTKRQMAVRQGQTSKKNPPEPSTPQVMADPPPPTNKEPVGQ